MAVLPTPVLILVEHEPRSSYGIIGYIARAFSVKNFDSKSVFVVQVVLLLVALAVYAAACYQALGRIFSGPFRLNLRRPSIYGSLHATLRRSSSGLTSLLLQVNLCPAATFFI